MKTKYRLKRKTYGIIGDGLGELTKGAGRAIKAAGSGIMGTVVGGALGSMIPGVSPLVGTIAGATIGKQIIQGAGNAVGKMGEAMQS